MVLTDTCLTRSSSSSSTTSTVRAGCLDGNCTVLTACCNSSPRLASRSAEKRRRNRRPASIKLTTLSLVSSTSAALVLFHLNSYPSGINTALAASCEEGNRLSSIEAINLQCDGETQIPWPEGFGNLLSLPFGLDIEQAKEFGKGLFKRNFMEVFELSGVTGDGQYRFMPNVRCKGELKGIHPIGSKGEAWTMAIWNDAQDWCSTKDNNCTGIMQFVGNSTENCHHWCGTPQFCTNIELEDDEELTIPSNDWNLWYKTRP
ncbi:unnamed protein product [Amoebophrya sp. A120]|nr:unnamed protein product [Amoebophrya sp. A120]|eukprot:GSA120T00003909001.1